MSSHANSINPISIDRSAISQAEHEAAQIIEQNLLHMQMAATEFRHTVDLYLFAHERKLAVDDQRTADEMWKMLAWMKLAGRNGAIIANGISAVMEGINSMNVPTIHARVDMDERKKATKQFASEFPTIAGIRNSAAHPGELSATAAETDRHRMKEAARNEGWLIGEDAGVFIQDSMAGDGDRLVYSASFKGRLVDYELSARKADALDAAVRHYCAAFYPLESAISAQRRTMLQEIDGQRQQGQNDRPPPSDGRS